MLNNAQRATGNVSRSPPHVIGSTSVRLCMRRCISDYRPSPTVARHLIPSFSLHVRLRICLRVFVCLRVPLWPIRVYTVLPPVTVKATVAAAAL